MGFYIFYMTGFIISLVALYLMFYEVNFREHQEEGFKRIADIVDNSRDIIKKNPIFGVLTFTFISFLSWVSVVILSRILIDHYIRKHNK